MRTSHNNALHTPDREYDAGAVVMSTPRPHHYEGSTLIDHAAYHLMTVYLDAPGVFLMTIYLPLGATCRSIFITA